MNLHLQVLKPLLKAELYNKYSSYLNVDFIEKNYPDIGRLYKVLPLLHKEDKEYTLDDLKVALFTAYPKADDTQYNRLFEELKDTEVDQTLLSEYLKEVAGREKALQIARLAIQASEGVIPVEDVRSRVNTVFDEAEEIDDLEQYFVTDDIEELYASMAKEKGLRWRLSSLNRALGEIRKSNFGFVFARPESGKTTFLASQLTFMAQQAEGPIIWFNNEQGGPDVRKRILQAYFAITEHELDSDPAKWNKLYTEAGMRGKLILFDKGDFTKREVERVCRKYKPSLVVFDQIDKIKGFGADRNDLELKAIYQWARELCKIYCPVIGVCQAGASGEDRKWLTMNDVDNSKTGKQGEADWILGIGKIHEQGFEQVRFLHLSKNKLHPEDSRERHGKWQVFIKPEVAQYADM